MYSTFISSPTHYDGGQAPSMPVLATQRLSPLASLPMALAQMFPPIELAEMEQVALLNRVETKYILHFDTLLHLLPLLRDTYRVLTVADQPLARYRTLYFDTPDLALYHSHHAGALNRYKVRAREYVDSAYSFLEVKQKTNKQRTVKQRIATPHLLTDLDDHSHAFLDTACPFSAADLLPVLWNTYRRITLVSVAHQERVTLDIDLHFQWQNRHQALPNLVTAEVKRAGRSQASPFVQLLHDQHVRRGGISKYCLGVSLLYPTVKANKFKKKHRRVAKVLQGDCIQHGSPHPWEQGGNSVSH